MNTVLHTDSYTAVGKHLVTENSESPHDSGSSYGLPKKETDISLGYKWMESLISWDLKQPMPILMLNSPAD
jgi:hypothetical protein